MRSLAIAVCTLGVTAFAHPVHAEEIKDEVKKEHVGHTKHKKEVVETKKVSDPGGIMNSTTDKTKMEKETKATAGGGSETTIEKKASHDAPHGDHMKSKSKEKIVKDADGKVIKDEVTK